LIHDAARPFIDRGIISGCVRTAEKYGAAIAGVPVKDTIKEAKVTSHKLQVTRSLTRDRLWQIQTPQAFRKSLILKAYRQFGSAEVTDDASLVEKLGAKVAVVKSSYSNIKITTPEDLIIAKVIAGKVKV
jgi:2-C-methyl-D-erythritol 4-phosphate cytidylyltransferase